MGPREGEEEVVVFVIDVAVAVCGVLLFVVTFVDTGAGAGGG